MFDRDSLLRTGCSCMHPGPALLLRTAGGTRILPGVSRSRPRARRSRPGPPGRGVGAGGDAPGLDEPRRTCGRAWMRSRRRMSRGGWRKAAPTRWTTVRRGSMTCGRSARSAGRPRRTRPGRPPARLGLTGAMAAVAALNGLRGPGQPGSAEVLPGGVPGAGGAVRVRDVVRCDARAGRSWPGSPTRRPGRVISFGGASDDEMLGVLCAWDRLEAHAAARKHAAVAELARRRPAPGVACWRARPGCRRRGMSSPRVS